MAKLRDGVGARRPYVGDDHQQWNFFCPGCEYDHTFVVKYGSKCKAKADEWSFNGNLDKPTFKPSLLYKETNESGFVVHICHSYVTDGKIQFLGDCTHHLAGKTVEMSDV